MKLHIGCGPKYLEGYKHMDAMEYPHVDYIGTADNLSVIADASLDEIYGSHILEHIGRLEIETVLKEWCRVLKPGGVIRLAVPDFGAVVAHYNEHQNLDKVMGLLYGGQTYEFNFHYQAYDLPRLTRLLTDAGFENVTHYDWQTFLPEDYDDFSKAYLPHMDFENGRLMSLNVTGTKR